ncbi:MAG: phosphoglycerate dehydrogenase, partial [Deltaproteobacteria bacterium]|nr:phosphoglycerate dehydrogenase [Deltaproteobacteria bacterium]
LGFANSHGIPVFNAPFSNTRSVAELVIAEVVMLSRRLGDRLRELHQGQWHKTSAGSREVRGKTLGIVGYGHIGSQVGVLAESFGMHVIYHDIASKLPMGNNRAVASLDELLSKADFVTLHVPATPQTRMMIGAKELAQMKPTAALLNLSRGSVVDIDALAEAIQNEQIMGAAIDVYPVEPRANGEDFTSPLVGLKNVVLSPHIGGSTEEAQASIGGEVSAVISKFLLGGATIGSVNFPQVELPRRADTHRIINVHKNVPGVMKEINAIMSKGDANILAQVLATDDSIGYMIADLDPSASRDVLRAIRELPTSIKTRMLES